jgi:predicted transcriptional regulator
MAGVADNAKRDLHALVDRLPEGRAALLLRALRDGDRTALYLASLPEDNEPATEAEQAAVAKFMEDVRAGRVRPWAEVRNRWLRR